MSFYENVRLAFQSIRINKLRSFLTMLGIIIGIAAVITITTIGNSLQKTIDATMNSMSGSNLLYCNVSPHYPETDEEWDTWISPDMMDEDYITLDELDDYIDAFADIVEYVTVSAGLGKGTVQGVSGKVNVSMSGVLNGNLEADQLKLLAGRDISDDDVDGERAVCVVSDYFVKFALGTEDNPLGRKVDLTMDDGTVIEAYVIGVYKYDSKIFNTVNSKTAKKDLSTDVYLPVSFAVRYYRPGQNQGFDGMRILVKNGASVAEVKEKTIKYFDDLKYPEGSAFHMSVTDMASQLAQINSILTVITVAVSVIAGISLVVGGVGVMNIMLISVMERTREIGIRKALGAQNKNIRAQFLTESIILCLLGGAIGISIGLLNGLLLSRVASTLVANFASEMAGYLTISVRPSMTAIVVSVGFSVLTGVAFGYYPANRAAKLEPIDALRYE